MEQIIILDFGSQYTQVIARRIRECKVYCQIKPWNTPAAEISALEPKGIILSGGPASVYSSNAPKPDPELFRIPVPMLGICYEKMDDVKRAKYHYKNAIKIQPSETSRKSSELTDFLPFLDITKST